MLNKIRNKIYDTAFAISWKDTFKTIAFLILATFVSGELANVFIEKNTVSVIYILTVVIVSSATTGYIYGTFAAVFGVFGVNFFFTYPYWAVDFTREGYPITFSSMLIASLITNTLTARAKEQARLAILREKRTDALYEITKNLLKTRELENIVTLSLETLHRLFGCSVVIYTEDPENAVPNIKANSMKEKNIFLSENDRFAARWTYLNQKVSGEITEVCVDSSGYYMPIISQEQVLGVVGIYYESHENLEQESKNFISMIIGQVALALERNKLSKQQNSILMEAEKEKMRSNLLRAISHDLRTPLTGILGASSVILENNLDRVTLQQLVGNIRDDSQWLIRMVENLLSVTRINQGTTTVKKTPEAVEEIVGESIRRIKKRFSNFKINVKVPDELLIVPMDGTLIEQVIINLIENAIKHSGSKEAVEILVKKEYDNAVIEISDCGKGVSEEDIQYLFEGYLETKTHSSDSSRGMGIGLSICKSIINAHSGEISCYNKGTGGALFKFTLPMEGGTENE